MPGLPGRWFLQLAPVAILVTAVLACIWHTEQAGPWALRNSLPPLLVLAMAGAVLWRGDGRWSGQGWRLPLALVGFAIPALGLSVYLHYAYAVNLDGMFDDGAGLLFRYLPVYTVGAGAIGAAIGWIVGGNVT